MYPLSPKSYRLVASGTLSFTAPQPISFQLSKDSLTDEVSVVIEGVIGTAATTANVDGLAAMAQQIYMRETSVAGQSLVRYNNVPGARLRDLYQAKGGQLPRVVGALGSTGYFRVEIPLAMSQLFLNDSFRYISAQKSFECSDITLQLNPASIAQLDLAVTPALVFTSANVYVMQRTFDRATVPAQLLTLPTLIEYKEYTGFATGQLQLELAGGGYYGLIGLTAKSGANTRQADGASVPFTTSATAGLVLQDMMRNNKFQTTYGDMRDDNHRKFVDALVTGNAWFLFNRGLNEFFDARNVVTASQVLPIIADLTAGSGAAVGITSERILYFDQVLSAVQGSPA